MVAEMVGGAINSVLGKAKIVNLSMPVDFVVFDLNPEKLQVKYANSITTETATAPAGGGILAGALALLQGNIGPVLSRVNLTTLTLTALLDDDYSNIVDKAIPGSVRRRAELLGAWTKPGGTSLAGAAVTAVTAAAKGKAINVTSMPPRLLFQWGEPFEGGFALQGYMQNVSIDYLRFDDRGNPTRARANLTFIEDPQSAINALTNPTSGGLPGRKAHVVAAGENLQSIATATYGKPGVWRKIAEVNGIDDPMRVPAGTKVYLPNPGELG